MRLKTYKFLFILLGIIKFTLLMIPAQAAVLYDFDADLEGFQLFGETGSPTFFYEQDEGNTASGAMGYSLQQTAPFGGVYNSTNIPIADWSSFNTVSFYVKADSAVADNKIQILFTESTGEVWIQETPFEPTTTFQKVEVNLVSSYGPATDGFVVSEGGDNYTLNLDNITGVTFVVNPSGNTPPDRVIYLIDDIELNTVTVQSALSISTNSITFGNPVSATVSDHRFSSDVLTVSYTAPIGSTWEIRVYTTRDDAVGGLVATDDSGLTIPLKFDIDADDDPEDDNAFGFPGSPPEDLRFFFVLDDGTTDAEGASFFSKLASSSQGDPSSNSSKLVNFAIDAAGAKANTTYSADVTLELHIDP